MKKSFFIITGISRGIGRALAERLLNSGHTVYGVSRSNIEFNETTGQFHHISFDLVHSEKIEDIMCDIFKQLVPDTYNMICLINNAALLEPLGTIERCPDSKLNEQISVNLVAPMILSSSFIRQTNESNLRRKVVNISSGSAIYPALGMSSYCASKSGLDMFTRCIGLEQKNKNNPVEVISIHPGMVETEMQVNARTRDERDFKMARYFKDVFNQGELQTTHEIASHLHRIIFEVQETGKVMNYSDD